MALERLSRQLDVRDLRRAHLLAVEDDLANLEGDLGVVDDKGDLSC